MWDMHILVLEVKEYFSQNIWVYLAITLQGFFAAKQGEALNLICLRWLELNYISHKTVVHFHCSELQDFEFSCTEYSHFQNVPFNMQFKMSSSGLPSRRDINIQE